MTLKELIILERDKNDRARGRISNLFWQGYYEGHYWACQGLLEILEHNGFDMDTIVFEK